MQVVCGDDCVDVGAVCCWFIKCESGKHGRADLCYKQGNGLSLMVADEFYKKIDELIKDNRRITQRDMAVKLSISQEHMGHIIAVLWYQKVCAR
jgi:hypothetical protein